MQNHLKSHVAKPYIALNCNANGTGRKSFDRSTFRKRHHMDPHANLNINEWTILHCHLVTVAMLKTRGQPDMLRVLQRIEGAHEIFVLLPPNQNSQFTSAFSVRGSRKVGPVRKCSLRQCSRWTTLTMVGKFDTQIKAELGCSVVAQGGEETLYKMQFAS